MATEIGTLIAKFVADTSNFDKGVKKVGDGMQQTAKQTQNFQNAITNAFSKVSPKLADLSSEFSGLAGSVTATGSSMAALAGPLAIAAAGFVATAAAVTGLGKQLYDLAAAAAEFQGKLYDLSQQTGVSVETLSALDVMARTTGSSTEAITASLGIFQKNLDDISGTSKASDALRELGIQTTDTEAALRQTLKALSQMSEGSHQTALALEIFGRGGKSILAILKEMQGDLDGTIEKLTGMGLVTTEQSKKADEFNDQLVLLSVQLRGLGTEIIPLVTGVLKKLSSGLKENRDAFEALQMAAKGVAFLFTGPMQGAISALTSYWQTHRWQLDLVVAAYNRIKAAAASAAGIPVTGGVALQGKPSSGMQLLQEVFAAGAPLPQTRGEMLAKAGAGGLFRSGGGGGGGGGGRAAKKLDIPNVKDLPDPRKIGDLIGNLEELYPLLDVVRFATKDWSVALEDVGRAADEIFSKEGGAYQFKEIVDSMGGKGTTEEMDRREAEIRDRMDHLAYNLTSVIDRAIYEGFEGGMKRGFASLAIGILDILKNVFLEQLQNSISTALMGVTGGGAKKGGWLSAIAGFAIQVLGGAAGGSIGGGAAGIKGGLGTVLGKASGGPVSSGTPYIVGERGPELFVPHSSGGIQPNAGNTIININVPVRSAGSYSTPKSRRQLAEDIAGALAGATS